MNIDDYYSYSFKGFVKNLNITIPIIIFYVLFYVILIIGVIMAFLILMGPNILINGDVSSYMRNIQDMGIITVLGMIFLVVGIVLFLIYGFASAATIGMAKKVINGKKSELDVGLKKGKKYFIKIFTLSIIMVLLETFTVAPAAIGLFVDHMYGLWPILTIIGSLITLIAYVAIFFVFIFTHQSIVIGKKSVISSIKDSVKIFRKNLWDVVVVLVINAVILLSIGAVMFVISLFLGIIPILGGIISLFLGFIVNSLTYPYFALVLTYVYMDKKNKITVNSRYID